MGQVSTRETKKPGGSRVFHNVLANNILLDLSIEEFFGRLWKDHQSMFYKQFLASIKCFDIKVEDWWLQESTFTVHRNIYCKHKNASAKTSLVQNVETIKEQTVTYNPVEKELIINETVTYHNAPHADKFKIYLTWTVKEVQSSVVPNVPPVLQSSILIDSRIEFHESFKGKKLRNKIASELIEELQIEYYLYYQFAQDLTRNLKNNRENFILSEMNKNTNNGSSFDAAAAATTHGLSMNLPSGSFAAAPPVTKVSPVASGQKDDPDEVSSLSSISNPPQGDSSDDEPPRSVLSRDNRSKASYSTSGDSLYGAHANPYLQCCVFIHYGAVVYTVIQSRVPTLAPVQLRDFLSVGLLAVCGVVLLLRVWLAKIRWKKVVNNFVKVSYTSFGLLFHAACSLSVASVPIPYYSLWIALAVFVLLPLVIAAFTTILKYNAATKQSSNFLGFVRVYIMIAYSTLVQLPLVMAFFIPHYVGDENMLKIQYALVVNHCAMVVLLNNEQMARDILGKSYLLLLFGFVVHAVILYLHH